MLKLYSFWRSLLLSWSCGFFVINDTHGNLLSVVSLLLSSSGLDSSGIPLFSKFVLSDLLLLHLMDGFNKNELVLIKVTLGMEVEVMIDILGDLLGFSIFLEKSSEDSLSSHPQDLDWHSCAGLTSPFTSTVVSSYNMNKSTLVLSSSEIFG